MQITPQDWEKAKSLFEAALELPPEERTSFLEQQCPDPEMRRQVNELLADYERAGDFLNSAETGPQAQIRTSFSCGDVLAGRFRVVRFLAAGGMGEVYEAEDLELRERVAIKTIRQDILRDRNAVSRFKQEVHLARKITHPNICRIFDLFRHSRAGAGGEQDEILFVTMELLSGETLADCLRREGKMSPAQALPIIRQMTAALAAAHQAGVVHRDLKPGNVILVHKGQAGAVRAVITDFGLALPATDSTVLFSLASEHGLLGTPAYLSPEQVEGKPATPASDIYALGLVVYQMVTGSLPFPGDTPMAAAVKRLSQDPLPPSKLNAQLSPQWSAAILACLQRDPAQRPRSVQELADALGGEGVVLLRRKGRRWIRLGAVAAVLVLAMAAVLAYHWRQRKRSLQTSAPLKLRPAVAVLGFKNLSARPDLNWISTALSEELTSELAAGDQLRMIFGEDVARMNADFKISDVNDLGKTTLARIRQASGSDLVVGGSYLEAGDQLRFDVRVLDTARGQVVGVVSETGTPAQLINLVSSAGAALREKCGVGAATASQTAEAAAGASTNTEAQRWYAQGLARLRAFDAQGARGLLQQAVAADPEYALAHAALAQAWWQLGYDLNARQESKSAFDLSSSLRPEERLWVEGRYREMEGQWPEAAKVYNTLWQSFPDTLEYGLRLVQAQLSAGLSKDALSTLAEMRRLPAPISSDPRIDLAGAQAAEYLGDLRRAHELAEKAADSATHLQLVSLAAEARTRDCWELDNLGEYDRAAAACHTGEQLYSQTSDRGGLVTVWINTGNLLADKGDLVAAQAAYNRAIEICQRIGNEQDLGWGLNDLAIIVRHQGDLVRARALHEEALTVFRQTAQQRGIAASLTNLAIIAAERGRLAESKQQFQQALQVQRALGDKRRIALNLANLAKVLYQQGNLPAAQAAGSEALSISREIGNRSLSGDALSHLASVSSAQGNLELARQRWEEARRIWDSLGQSARVAVADVELARLAQEQGHAPADEVLQSAIRTFQMQQDGEDEVSAHLVRCQELVNQGRLAEAAAEVTAATKLTATSSPAHREEKWEIELASARLATAAGKGASSISRLRSMIAETHRAGFLALEFEARLVLGEVEIRTGNKQEGWAELERLAHDAQAKNFALVAKEAAAKTVLPPKPALYRRSS